MGHRAQYSSSFPVKLLPRFTHCPAQQITGVIPRLQPRNIWNKLLRENHELPGHRGTFPTVKHTCLLQSSVLSVFTSTPSSHDPTLLLAIAAAFGLPVALWLYKCLIMIIFQRKIIYMGYVPLGARREQLSDARVSEAIRCEEIHVQSDKRVMLAGLYLRPAWQKIDSVPNTVVVYFQGNAGNTLARIPVFERLLGSSSRLGLDSRTRNIAVIAVAPRSYWKSSRRGPTERGLLSDYEHVLSYVSQRFPTSTVVLYGHSLGGAIAVCLASHLSISDYPLVKGLILENPFSSIPGMVKALYPQRWLPYHHLTPFALDKWDAVAAMQTARYKPGSLLGHLSDNMLVLLSEKDEVVPTSMGTELYEVSNGASPAGGETKDLPDHTGLKRRVVIEGALHEDAWIQRQWLQEMHMYLDGLQKMDL